MARVPADSSVFAAIASDTRRALLDALCQGELPVGDLVARLEMSQPAVSQQLNILKEAGLVAERSQGRFRFYRLQPEPLLAVVQWMERYRTYWERNLDALGDVLDGLEDPPAQQRPRRKP